MFESRVNKNSEKYFQIKNSLKKFRKKILDQRFFEKNLEKYFSLKEHLKKSVNYF